MENQTEVSGIFVSEHKMNNMDMERIVVSNPAILKILELVKLPIEDQHKAVDALVDRTPEWKDLEPEEQVDKIKAVLTQETVLYYLQSIETIRPQVDMCETGIDSEGSVVIYAYYTNMNREMRRAMSKKFDDQKQAEIVEAINIFSGNDKLVDLAQKKLEKLQKEGKLPKRK